MARQSHVLMSKSPYCLYSEVCQDARAQAQERGEVIQISASVVTVDVSNVL